MYREQIEIYMDENKYIKLQKPAGEKAVEKAEKRMGVTFPENLRQFLFEMNGDQYLMFSTDDIVENNEIVREGLGECYEGLDKLLFIAGNGCGDYYGYNIKNGNVDESEIVIWEHEDNEKHMVAKTISQLIDRYYQEEI